MTTNDTLMTLLHDVDGVEPHVDCDLEAIKARAVRESSRARALTIAGGAAVGVSAMSWIVYLAVPGQGAGKPAHVALLGGADCRVASVTAVGESEQGAGWNEVLASAHAGSPVSVGAMLHVIKPANMLDVELIVGTPDSTAGAGAPAALPQTAALRAKNQVAASTADSPRTGAQITVITPPLAAGSYPVYYVLHFVDAPGCTAAPGVAAQVETQLGVVEVTA
jgi:hypothetical protein